MLLPNLSRSLSVFAAALLSVMLAGQAHALTLQDLVDGDTFSTDNGLFFSDFEAQISGDLADQIDASDIDVVVLADGFLLAGPLSAADGEIGDVLISYSVSAESAVIVGASLLTNGVAFGSGAQAAVDELLIADTVVLGMLSAWDTGAVPGDAIFYDEIGFAPVQEIRVLKDILLDSATSKGAGSARISLIEQHFIVPEPGTLALLGMGLAGIASMGRRRARQH